MYSISQAARFLGVSIPTLRRWEASQKLIPIRTIGNHHRYNYTQLINIYGIYDKEQDKDLSEDSERVLYLYARVSSPRH
jgi:excisionase family DNA binding protein